MIDQTDSIANHNSRSWDRLAQQSHALTKPVTDAELSDAKKILDPIGWLEGDVRNRRVLCLAAGGGRFSALFAALGAQVTVVDISPAMLATDQRIADKHGFNIRILQADMTKLSAISDATFDLVMQPVSTTYVSEPRFAFAEVARVTVPNGLYISFHKQPTSLQSSLTWDRVGYVIERPAGAAIQNPVPMQSRLREAGTIEHAHSLQTLLGGICRAGFVVEDLMEPQYGDLNDRPGSFAHRCAYIPPYIAVKARRKVSRETFADNRQLIIER